jgi:hypothetical protein
LNSRVFALYIVFSAFSALSAVNNLIKLMYPKILQNFEPGVHPFLRALACFPVQISTAALAQSPAVFPANNFGGKGQQNLVLDEGGQIDLLSLIKIRLQIFPAQFEFLGRGKVGLGFQTDLKLGSQGKGERFQAPGTGTLGPGFDAAGYQNDLSGTGKVYPGLDWAGETNPRIGGLPTQALVERTLILGKRFFPPFLGYVFQLKFQGTPSRMRIRNIKNLNI